MESFEKMIKRLLSEASGLAPETFASLVSAPPKPEMGDYAVGCFPLAKAFRKDPKKIAADLKEKVDLGGTPFSSAEAAGPYLNFRLDDAAMARLVLEAIRQEGERFGHSDFGAGKTVIVDFSSPNIAKPFHIGHLRSTVIGASLYKIYGALGYKPIGINHLGDWGTQFGMVMAAFEEDGSKEALEKSPISYSLKLYVDYNKKCELDPQARELAKSWFVRLEEKDAKALDLWSMFRDLSLRKFEKIYERLGVGFDYYTGESFYNDKMEGAFQRVEKAGILSRSEDGAEMIDLDDYGMPPFILKKSDGATLYATREIAAALYREETYSPSLLLYVVGTPQELHFRQFVQSLKLMKLDLADKIVHVKFGHVHGMSTRKGEVVLLEDVLDEAAAKALEKIEENLAAGKLEQGVEKMALAESVGIGAIIINDLKHRRERDVSFDWEQALRFDGETGPYLQYSLARVKGILRKAGVEHPSSPDYSQLCEPETRALVRALADFPAAVEKAARDNEPSHVTTYLFDLTKAFNLFYTRHRVIGAGKEKEGARIGLVSAAGVALANGMRLLGVPVLERM